MIKSKHRRTYLVDRITSSLRGADEKQPGNELPAQTAGGAATGAPHAAQRLLALGLMLGFLAIPLGILYILLN